MSVKTHSSVPIGERKTDKFLLRLSKQSQDKIAAGSLYAGKAGTDGQSIRLISGYQKPQRPLYTSENAQSDLKPKPTKPAFLSNSVNASSQIVGGDVDVNSRHRSVIPLASDIILKESLKIAGPPKPPTKPQKLSLSAAIDTIPALQPSKPKIVGEPVSESQRLVNIEIELPSYVARKEDVEVTPFSDSGSIIEPKVFKSLQVAGSLNQGPPKPPKIPFKPTFAPKLDSQTSKSSKKPNVPVTPSKIAPMKPLKPRALSPPRVHLDEVGNIEKDLESEKSEAHGLYKPRFKPILLNKPALPLKSSLVSQNKTSKHSLPSLLPQRVPISSDISKKDNTLFTKPAPSSKHAILSKPKALAQAKSVHEDNSRINLSEKLPALPDFKATLASVIRAQTEPLFSKRNSPGQVVRAKTVIGSKDGDSSTSEPSKLTHPNKSRSKGPKRRLPKGNLGLNSQVIQAKNNFIPMKKDPMSPKSSLGTPSVQLQPINKLVAQVNNLQPVEKRVPPPKGKKPDFKHITIPTNK